MSPFRLAAVGALARLIGYPRATAVTEGWRVLAQHPEAIRDLAILGHLFESDVDPATGRVHEGAELTARAARRSLVLTLLARAEITEDELSIIRKEDRSDGYDMGEEPDE